jgi:dTDP-4-dehydrorhamnose reductase
MAHLSTIVFLITKAKLKKELQNFCLFSLKRRKKTHCKQDDVGRPTTTRTLAKQKKFKSLHIIAV